MAKDLPTDLELLNEIYCANLRAFTEFTDENRIRSTKIWVPIEIETLAKHFRTDPDMIFGRLYYHLNGKYRIAFKENESLEFFQLRVGKDRHCVNFPYLASILADLREDHRRFAVATGIALLSLVISLASIGMVLFI